MFDIQTIINFNSITDNSSGKVNLETSSSRDFIGKVIDIICIWVQRTLSEGKGQGCMSCFYSTNKSAMS